MYISIYMLREEYHRTAAHRIKQGKMNKRKHYGADGGGGWWVVGGGRTAAGTTPFRIRGGRGGAAGGGVAVRLKEEGE